MVDTNVHLFHQTAYLVEHLVSWLLLLVSLPLCAWVLWGIRDSNYDVENATHIEDVPEAAITGIALPPGHVAGEHLPDDGLKAPPELKTKESTSS